jgi:hypothetical protein
MADGHYGGGHSISDGTPCKSGSIEVSSPTFAPFICEAGRPCDMCLRYYQSKTAATAKATEMKLKASASQSGASSGSPEESQKPLSESSELMSISSSSDASLVRHFPYLVVIDLMLIALLDWCCRLQFRV